MYYLQSLKSELLKIITNAGFKGTDLKDSEEEYTPNRNDDPFLRIDYTPMNFYFKFRNSRNVTYIEMEPGSVRPYMSLNYSENSLNKSKVVEYLHSWIKFVQREIKADEDILIMKRQTKEVEYVPQDLLLEKEEEEKINPVPTVMENQNPGGMLLSPEQMDNLLNQIIPKNK